MIRSQSNLNFSINLFINFYYYLMNKKNNLFSKEHLTKINLKDVDLINYPMNTVDELNIMNKILGIDNFETTKVIFNQ